MDWTQIVTIIIGSSVVSTLLNIGYSSYIKGEERNKLYGPVRFYLMLMQKNTEVRKRLLDSRQSLDKKFGFSDPEDRRMKIYIENNNELIKEWWSYAKRVLQAFEDHPELINPKDWAILNKLYSSHLLRKTVSGEAVPKSDVSAYDNDIFEEDAKNTFVELFDELRKNLD